MTILTMLGHGELEEARDHWKWLLGLGLLLLILGTLALSMAITTTAITVLFFGSLLLLTGIAQIVAALRHQAPGHFWLHLLTGLLDLVLGALMIFRPLAGAAVLTLVLAAFLFIGGIYRIIGAASLRLPSWGWSLLSGVIDLSLALLLLLGWPVTGLWFLGFCIGLGLIFRGWAFTMLALIAHRTPAR